MGLFRIESKDRDTEKEYLRSQKNAIRYMLDMHVKPHVKVNNLNVLIVGMRDRFAEAFAIFESFQPNSITTVDTSNNWVTTLNYWIHVLYKKPGQAIPLLSSVSFNRQDVRSVEGNYDLVCSFSVSPTLQDQDSINNLLSLSSGISVITARKSSGEFWDSVPEHTHLDQLIEQTGQHILVQDLRLSLPTNDGHLWVVTPNES